MTMLISEVPVSASQPMQPSQRLNELLGLELSAQASYSITADRWQDLGRGTWIGLLRQLAEEHELAAQSLREQIRDLRAEPDDKSGSLGLWAPIARAIQGEELILLREARGAEQQMLDHYEEAVSTLDSGSAQLLRNLLIPTEKRHVQLLTDLMNA